MEADLTIVKENDSTMLVVPREANIGIELQDFFSFEKENSYWQKKNRRGWDGITRLYSNKTGRIPVGLLPYVLKFAKNGNYTTSVDPALTQKSQIDKEEFVKFVNEVIQPYDKGKPLKPYDDQFYAVYYALIHRRVTFLSATSSGKSLIIYLLSRILELSEEKGPEKRILITVPTKQLVEQLYNDFDNYSNNGKLDWRIEQHVQKVTGEYDQRITKNIVISTWHSAKKFYNLNEFGVWICDEAHDAKAKSFKEIGKKLTECPFKIGMTGSLDNSELHKLEIIGNLGHVKKIVSAKQLEDKGRASKVKVYGVMLEYPQSARRYLHELKKEARKKKQSAYEAEIQFLMDNLMRNQYICDMAKGLKGNTLIISGRIEKHIEPLFEKLEEESGKPVFQIHGKVDTEVREEIRQIVENYDNAIIIGSWGTVSTGISIKNLHNFILALPLKAKIKILQSIGRMMRLHDSKDMAKYIDIGDDLSFAQKANFSMSHMRARFEHYFSEGRDVKFVKIPLSDKG